MAEKPGPTHRWSIITIVSGPEGYHVDLFGGMLSVGRMENEQYRVYRLDERGKMFYETIHDEPGDAVDAFLKLREEIKLGYDFERSDQIDV